MKSNICRDYIAVLTHGQVECGCLDLRIQQTTTRHPTKITARQWVCLECQFIEVGSAIQLVEKIYSRLLIIEQNLLNVYLLGGTGDGRNDFVTHPGGFCAPSQR